MVHCYEICVHDWSYLNALSRYSILCACAYVCGCTGFCFTKFIPQRFPLLQQIQGIIMWPVICSYLHTSKNSFFEAPILAYLLISIYWKQEYVGPLPSGLAQNVFFQHMKSIIARYTNNKSLIWMESLIACSRIIQITSRWHREHIVFHNRTFAHEITSHRNRSDQDQEGNARQDDSQHNGICIGPVVGTKRVNT